jgi:hypothetical protein
MQQAWSHVKERVKNHVPPRVNSVSETCPDLSEIEETHVEPTQYIITITNVNDKRSTSQDEAEAKHSIFSNCRLAKSCHELFVDGEGDCENGILILGQCLGQVEREQGVTTKLAVLTPRSLARHFAVRRKIRRLYISCIVRFSKIVSAPRIIPPCTCLRG